MDVVSAEGDYNESIATKKREIKEDIGVDVL